MKIHNTLLFVFFLICNSLQENPPILQFEYSDFFKIARTLPWVLNSMDSKKLGNLVTPLVTGGLTGM